MRIVTTSLTGAKESKRQMKKWVEKRAGLVHDAL